MRSVVVRGPNTVEMVDDLPMPVIGDYECLARIRACGFCNGTDFDIITNTMGAMNFPYPIVLGHENAGEVVELGSKVRNIQIGDRYINIGVPIPESAGYSRGFGAMSEYGVITDFKAMEEDGCPSNIPMARRRSLRRIPNNFDFADAGVVLTLTECYSAVINFGIDSTKDVLIYGSGPMGLAIMKFMRLRGVKSITTIDFVDERLELAKKMANVDLTINPKKENLNEILGDKLFDVVIDAVGMTSIILEGSKRLKPYGQVGCLGVLKSHDINIHLPSIKNNTNIHMLNFPYLEYEKTPDIIGLIACGEIDPKDFYSHTRPVEKIGEVLELVKSKEAIKVIVMFD